MFADRAFILDAPQRMRGGAARKSEREADYLSIARPSHLFQSAFDQVLWSDRFHVPVFARFSSAFDRYNLAFA